MKEMRDVCYGDYIQLYKENDEIKNSLSLIAIDNSKLELENKKLREALEFYANKNNWDENYCNSNQYSYEENSRINESDMAKICTNGSKNPNLGYGGKRARKALETK